VHLRHSNPLERHVFAKPFFDPAGLILAEEDGKLVGFAHAGFGPGPNEATLSTKVGILCAIAVRPGHRRRGIGSALLERCESYLTDRGSQTLLAGPLKPNAPFYLGLYGGSDLPGFLASDPDAAPFLARHGYEAGEPVLVYQHRLDEPLVIADARFSSLRRRFELRVLPRIPLGSWWQECVLGLIEPVEFRLEDKLTNRPVARAIAWEMEGFSWRWSQPAVGLMDVLVLDSMRRQGIGKFLVAQVLRYLQDQFFAVAEVHAPAGNAAAVGLFRTLGFEQVDEGRSYRKV
jgi:ribosomal protein S18 acetylase RimI-like enzyme